MPVVTRVSNIAQRAYGGPGGQIPQALNGNPLVKVGTVTNAVDDLAGSKYRLCDLPSDCFLEPSLGFRVDLWGFATVNIGTETDPVALGTVLRSAGAVWQPVTIGDARHGIPLWELLGLAKNPRTDIALFAHGPANATVAGSLKFRLAYLWRA